LELLKEICQTSIRKTTKSKLHLHNIVQYNGGRERKMKREKEGRMNELFIALRHQNSENLLKLFQNSTHQIWWYSDRFLSKDQSSQAGKITIHVTLLYAN
jgi:hypothetical protein